MSQQVSALRPSRPRTVLVAALIISLSTLGLVMSPGAARAQKPSAPASAVLTWNDFAADLIVNTEHKLQPESYVYMAYTQAAVYDAVVAVSGHFPAYLPGLAHRPHASVDAAVAAAAHRILTHYFPDQLTALDARYQAALTSIPDGPAEDSGVALGTRSADRILAARADDGFGDIETYTPAPGPGVWAPTPPAFLPAQTPQLATMTPFTFDPASRFRPGSPPALGSPAWATAFNEVKDLGSEGSATRTADQTATARFWLGNVVLMYNEALRGLASSHALDAVHAARLLVTGAVVGADALIACFDAKYHYGFWRPVTAIRAADTDGNEATSVDPTWTPLLVTPNHPEYPSAHGCISSAQAAVVAGFLGTSNVGIELHSSATGTMRHFDTVSDWLTSVGNGRIWAGIHYRFSTDAGVELGTAVARNALSHGFLAAEDD
jgi:hypothetical protein